jgi:transcription elongation GreA/GreB family factor
MDKKKLKEDLLQIEQDSVHAAEINYEEFLKDNSLDQSEIIDEDDQSHYHSSQAISQKLDDQIQLHQQHLKTLATLDFSPTETVRPGAVVKLNGKYMVVGISEARFVFEDKSIIGISTEAPIYACIKDKKAGDTCTFNGTSFKIQEVH